ncbi:MAG: efflux RND transporter periplasmic adaptor subunit [Bacteroidetes bacterium]|nr:efflux RND transporter periplasmic adaptor subunit [Bacteroidota bacterium]
MKNILIVIIIFLISACGHDPKTKETASKCLNDTMLKAIELDTVHLSLVQHELKMTGKVSFDQENTQKIFPLASGRVVKVNVENGDFVKKGDVLAVINSSEAADYESQLSAAESKMIIAERNRNAVSDMYKDGLSSERELVSARKEYDVAAAEFNKQKQYQKIFSLSGVSTYTVRAPISGYIVEKNINPEFYIRTDDNVNIFTISNISDVWVMVNLYEVDLDKIKVGYEAEVKTLSYDKIYYGVIDKIFNVVDPISKTLKARVKLHNADYALKPEMFAGVTINYAEKESKLYVPSNAIIFDKNKYFVMVYKDKCNIETREINLYLENKGKTYINTGLTEGEKVISKLQLLVYDQMND